MVGITTSATGRLAGSTIAILMESDYVEPELHYYQRRFAEEGAKTVFLTRLWGQPSITFHGHEFQLPFTVDGDLEAVDQQALESFDALIVPSGMVSDRLRYTDDAATLAPAVQLLKRAFDTPGVLKGIICHGMWLAAPIPEVVAGRRITCHNNLLGDVKNMAAVYTDQDVVVDGDLVTARSADHCHQFAHTIIDLVEARRARRPSWVHQARSRSQPQPQPVAQSHPVAREDAGYAPDFSFSDLVAGYVTSYDAERRVVGLRRSDGRAITLNLDDSTAAEFVRNLADPYLDASGHLNELLTPGRQLFAHGVFYPQPSGYVIEVKRLIFVGRGVEDHVFDVPGWWIHQLRELAQFYRHAQFGDGEIDFTQYRTMLRLGGDKNDSDVQETDTISRLVYGMSSAYMLTGDEDFLEVAQHGVDYLREHMRFVDRDEDVTYWYHGIDTRGGREHKLFTSDFGDDYDAIPMYEQIYALCGMTQLYRVTGDPKIAEDIDGTLRLFEKFFRDDEHGGYFSHIDPILLSPHHDSLGPNKSRKNWNSVGDHAPAYLINLFLATGEQRHQDMLEDTFDTIAKYLPHADDSPFVQERFHADWSVDQGWGWQQDNAVVGHNLKIAWNMMRMMSIRPKPEYQALAQEIGRRMPELGSDQQRGGWYDVVERQVKPGRQRHRFVWHDRKAWWQQEQAILAYQILAGVTGDAEFRRQYTEAASFYNAFFLDHDEGGVYFNVLANGTPYLVGTERLKGSHSMSMYHAAELCFLATVYGNLLLAGKPLSLWFKPDPNAFSDHVLRVAPDALPPGRVRLQWVEVAGRPYSAFDPVALTIKLPESEGPVTVRAHLVPVEPSDDAAEARRNIPN